MSSLHLDLKIDANGGSTAAIEVKGYVTEVVDIIKRILGIDDTMDIPGGWPVQGSPWLDKEKTLIAQASTEVEAVRLYFKAFPKSGRSHKAVETRFTRYESKLPKTAPRVTKQEEAEKPEEEEEKEEDELLRKEPAVREMIEACEAEQAAQDEAIRDEAKVYPEVKTKTGDIWLDEENDVARIERPAKKRLAAYRQAFPNSTRSDASVKFRYYDLKKQEKKEDEALEQGAIPAPEPPSEPAPEPELESTADNIPNRCEEKILADDLQAMIGCRVTINDPHHAMVGKCGVVKKTDEIGQILVDLDDDGMLWTEPDEVWVVG